MPPAMRNTPPISINQLRKEGKSRNPMKEKDELTSKSPSKRYTRKPKIFTTIKQKRRPA
jgi:hypothetical protein